MLHTTLLNDCEVNAPCTFDCVCCTVLLFRGFRIVGPFVVMIYKMIHTDLLRFFAIYLVFLIGFSQGNSCSSTATL